MLTNTFLILFALETLTLKQLGWVLGVKFGVQALTDYPTGALGDWIGQRWVLFISAVSYGVGLLILSYSGNINQILISFGIIGFAQGQESGSFNSWFDNNYILYVSEDHTRQTYGQLLGKFTMVKELITAIAFIFGGFIIYFSSRQLLFYFQGIFLLLFSFIFLIYLKEHPSAPHRELHLRNYFSFFNQGLSTVYNDRNLSFLVLGMMITGSGMMLWAGLMMLPLYESYGKTDTMTAMLRSTIWVFGAIATGIAGIISKRIKNIKKVLSLSFIGLDLVFFGIMYVMVSFFESTSEFNLILFILLIVAFTIGYTGRYFVDVLMPRYFLDKIPNSNRNAIYSLIPTLIMVVSVPYLIIGGILLQHFTIQKMFLILAVNGLIGSLLCAYGIYLPEEQHDGVLQHNRSDKIVSIPG
ncbi:MAG: MFS transporter [Candidatus Heimdallarchaeota archaeon]|nr:MFS transporter [Candidatus Heimdallarchaeota archaeon]